ncbi:type VII toxin-antitoxin system MntA family adenylyltransferase antitoxin [Ectopseudomonas oleovorans]|uniref:Nucleotidyltransferase domain-containing protein n=1 Tax=Ectopseudomonas oleovorans TaxID=301 RepID=A0A427HNE8_ECTOL|nr:nucleotidyltransferase domain-containing protein [Pseudomonas oleovorans]RRW36238.1 nucleotidyltransferase domain-containing protein [Pseudomonas oleovorans]
MNKVVLVELLRSRLDGVLAVYAFGSRIQGTADERSDLDLAVLVQGYADPLMLWDLAGDAADIAGCPVDLLDLRRASTVMQQQVLTKGERWWAVPGDEAGLFECAVLSEKLELDRARAPLLRDIERDGRVYGR